MADVSSTPVVVPDGEAAAAEPTTFEDRRIPAMIRSRGTFLADEQYAARGIDLDGRPSALGPWSPRDIPGTWEVEGAPIPTGEVVNHGQQVVEIPRDVQPVWFTVETSADERSVGLCLYTKGGDCNLGDLAEPIGELWFSRQEAVALGRALLAQIPCPLLHDDEGGHLLRVPEP